MSKHSKTSRHRIPTQVFEHALDSDPIDERYQAEIDMSMNRLQRRYDRARKALAAAERKAERVKALLAAAAERQRRREEELAAEESRQAQRAEQARADLERVKEAAQRQRTAIARQRELAGIERVRQAQLAAERRRRTELERARREAVEEAKRRSREYDQLLMIVEDRRRELREIEKLMIPDDYGNRDSRRRIARHEPGGITIPLGATTGERPKVQKPPVFPVIIKQAPERELDYELDFDDIYDYET